MKAIVAKQLLSCRINVGTYMLVLYNKNISSALFYIVKFACPFYSAKYPSLITIFMLTSYPGKAKAAYGGTIEVMKADLKYLIKFGEFDSWNPLKF